MKSLFNNYNINYIIDPNSNFINNIKSFKETKLDSIKFSDSIEGLNSEVPFFGTYLEQIYKDLDPEEEEENTKERVLNNMPSFSWKFLRLLSEGDISKINAEEVYKLLSISEDYYKNFAPKDTQVKFNFKILTPPPKIELKPKEEIPLPKELLEKNHNETMNVKEVKEETSEEEINNNKPVISLPIELIEKEKDIINKNNIANNSNTENNIKINEIKITPKKEEVKEKILLPSNLKFEEIKNKEEKEKNINISNLNNEIQSKVEEKETNHTKKEIKNEEKINNSFIKKENSIKESISLPKEIEKNNIDKKINSEEIRNLNINDIEINKCDNEKKKELDDKFQIKKFKEEINISNNINNNNNQAINLKQNSDINAKSNNAYNKETGIIKKESKEINKSMKMSDSTIPAGIINISKDSKNPSLISKESKSIKIENIGIPKDNKIDINLNSKTQKVNTNINNNNFNKISNNNINKNIKENTNNINNKNSHNTKIDTNNFHNNTSKVFTDRKSPDKNLLNNISSGNKINNNGNNMNRQSVSLNKSRPETKTNHYDHKYNNKYDNKYSNKNNDTNYDNKNNNKNDNKYTDKYINKYDNNKFDYKNDNRYGNRYVDKFDNNYNYKHENNNNYKYDNYDNRYRYDNNNRYERSQEKDNHFINKKRYNDDKYENYMSSSKKRK